MNVQLQHYKTEFILKLSRFKYGVKALQFYGHLKYRLKCAPASTIPLFGDTMQVGKYQLTTYSPQTRLHDSLWTILKHFFLEIKRTRWQIWVTFKRDFVSAYNQTTVGLLWSVVMPLIPISVYLLLAYLRVLRTTENMPFVVYIVVGMTIWTFLSGSLTSPILAIQKSKVVLETSKYPILAVILSNFGQMIYQTSIRIIFVVLVLIFYKISLSWNILLLPLLILPLALFSLSLGIILAIVNVIIRDVQNVVDIVMRYGVFLSSVIFPMTETGLIGTLNLFNPFNTFVIAVRNFIVFGQIPHLTVYLVTTGVSILLFLVACKVLYIMEYRLKAFL
jgi:lipopolysaccharide transport system permease protein